MDTGSTSNVSEFSTGATLINRFEPQQVGGRTVVAPILDGRIKSNMRADQVLKNEVPFSSVELQHLVGCLNRRAEDLLIAAAEKEEGTHSLHKAPELDQLMAEYLNNAAEMITDAITQPIHYRDILLSDHLMRVRSKFEAEHVYLRERLAEKMRHEMDSIDPSRDVEKIIVPRLAYEWNNAVAEILGVEREVSIDQWKL